MESVVGIAMAPTADMSRSASMGGGDDSMALVATGSGTVDGGPGRDRFYSDTCTTVRARLGGTLSCVPRIAPEVTHTFGFAGWEDLLVRGQDVSLRGSDRAEKMKVVAARIRLKGNGGSDVLNPNGNFGWESYDVPVVVSGGRGDDRVLGTPHADLLRGGPGRDKLFGQGGDDTLQGGTGRDKAVGKDGRDRCSAEVRRTCETR
jgi:Ca2+-binding RTX toxin-like protein